MTASFNERAQDAAEAAAAEAGKIADAGASGRIGVIDALRGSALLGLFLLHTVEHFDMGHGPASVPA